MSYSLGNVKKMSAKKDSKEYFAGMLFGCPVTGFWGTKKENEDVVYFSLNHAKAKYLDEHGQDKEDNKPQGETKEQ